MPGCVSVSASRCLPPSLWSPWLVLFAFHDERKEGSATLANDAAVAQLAEQLFCKQQVTGSIPVGGSTAFCASSAPWPTAINVAAYLRCANVCREEIDEG